MKWPYDESEQLGKLSEQELNEILARNFAGPRQGRAPFRGLGYQGRLLDAEPLEHKEAAEAVASEFIEEATEPPPGRHVPRWEWMHNRWVGVLAVIAWPLAFVAIVVGCAAFIPGFRH